MVTRKKPKPKPGGRWEIGVYELKRTAACMGFVAIGLATNYFSRENVMALWDKPGINAGIGLIVAGAAKLLHQWYLDNSKK